VEFDKYLDDDEDEIIQSFLLDSVTYSINYLVSPNVRLVIANNNDTLDLKIDTLVKKLNEEFGAENSDKVPYSKMQWLGSLDSYDFKIYYKSLQSSQEDSTTKITRVSGYLLAKKNK
jgi:hypothetical protein